MPINWYYLTNLSLLKDISMDTIENTTVSDFHTSSDELQLDNTNKSLNINSSTKKKKPFYTKVLTVLFLLCFITLGGFFFYEWKLGTFSDWNSFKNFINSFGWGGPIFLAVFQCLKVPYVVIAGGIGCGVGAAIFGWWKACLANYIGLASGSILAFFISKKYGTSLMLSLFKEKQYNRYLNLMNKYKKHYSIILWLCIASPIAPDDFLCYFSGATGMSNKRFIIIILTAKIWSILGYSLIFGL